MVRSACKGLLSSHLIAIDAHLASAVGSGSHFAGWRFAVPLTSELQPWRLNLRLPRKPQGGETPAQRRLGIPLSSLLDTATHPKCSRSRLFLVTRRAAPRLRAADRTPPSHRTRHRQHGAPPLAGLTNRARTGTIGELHLPPSGPVAQLGARFHGMEEVVGSIPIRSTN